MNETDKEIINGGGGVERSGEGCGRGQKHEADRFQRTRRLIGAEALEMLRTSKILVFGVGGVGGYVCEALARAGVGRVDIVDKDVVDITNINRQIIATTDTIGLPKVGVCK